VPADVSLALELEIFKTDADDGNVYVLLPIQTVSLAVPTAVLMPNWQKLECIVICPRATCNSNGSIVPMRVIEETTEVAIINLLLKRGPKPPRSIKQCV
jgi:hypothetical protein